jgi:hypothetical protein
VSVSRIELQIKRKEELGGKEEALKEITKKKEEGRKSSFSPSIFVRRYLPFMK